LGVIWVVVVNVSDGTTVVVDGMVLFLSFFVFSVFLFLSGMVDGMVLFFCGRRWWSTVVVFVCSYCVLAGVRWWRLVLGVGGGDVRGGEVLDGGCTVGCWCVGAGCWC
jgi:hypothetical protein